MNSQIEHLEKMKARLIKKRGKDAPFANALQQQIDGMRLRQNEKSVVDRYSIALNSAKQQEETDQS
jgi:hypothetical protein